MRTEILSHVCLTEAKLSFHSERISDSRHSPAQRPPSLRTYSSGFVLDPIRVATIAPAGENHRLYDFMRQLNSPAQPRERREHLPKWPSFRSVFGLRMQGAARHCHIQLEAALEKEIESSSSPHVPLTASLSRAIQTLDALRADFDVLFIYIPMRWCRAFKGGPEEHFDLHDHIKAMTATRRMPVQPVREDKALAYPCRASVICRIGLALYVKAGGVPWKLASLPPENADVGGKWGPVPIHAQTAALT